MNEVKASPLIGTTIPLEATPPVTATSPWSKRECTQERVQATVLEKFQAIVDHAEARAKALKAYEAGDEEYKKAHRQEVTTSLKGYWYANEYCRALTVTGQTPRLEYLKKTGAFYHGFPPYGFDTVKDSKLAGGKRPCAYVLKRGISPTSGLRSIREGVVPEEIVQEYVKKGEEAKAPKSSVGLIDCQEAIQIAYYETLLEVWGEETFNRKFSAAGKTPFSFDVDTVKTPLPSFMTDQLFDVMTEGKYNEAKYRAFYNTIQKGDELFIKNVTFYNTKFFNGEASGFHCLRSQGGVIALGVSERPDEQMLELLAKECNGSDIENTVLYSGDFLVQMQKEKQQRESNIPPQIRDVLPTFQINARMIKEAHQVEPMQVGLIPSIRRLDAAKIRNELN